MERERRRAQQGRGKREEMNEQINKTGNYMTFPSPK